MFAYILDAAEDSRAAALPQLVAVSRSAARSRSAASRSCRCRSSTAACRCSASDIGTFAYLTDCNRIPDESWPLLDGVRTVDPRRAALPAALDAFQRRSRRVDVVAHGSAPSAPTSHICHDLAPRRDLRAPARPAWSWLMMGLVLEITG